LPAHYLLGISIIFPHPLRVAQELYADILVAHPTICPTQSLLTQPRHLFKTLARLFNGGPRCSEF